LQNKQNEERFTCDKLKVIFNIYIYGFAHMTKLGNQSTKTARQNRPKHGKQNAQTLRAKKNADNQNAAKNVSIR